jgi:hypothetical protein
MKKKLRNMAFGALASLGTSGATNSALLNAESVDEQKISYQKSGRDSLTEKSFDKLTARRMSKLLKSETIADEHRQILEIDLQKEKIKNKLEIEKILKKIEKNETYIKTKSQFGKKAEIGQDENGIMVYYDSKNGEKTHEIEFKKLESILGDLSVAKLVSINGLMRKLDPTDLTGIRSKISSEMKSERITSQKIRIKGRKLPYKDILKGNDIVNDKQKYEKYSICYNRDNNYISKEKNKKMQEWI